MARAGRRSNRVQRVLSCRRIARYEPAVYQFTFTPAPTASAQGHISTKPSKQSFYSPAPDVGARGRTVAAFCRCQGAPWQKLHTKWHYSTSFAPMCRTWHCDAWCRGRRQGHGRRRVPHNAASSAAAGRGGLASVQLSL
jgi:hypothetical protein